MRNIKFSRRFVKQLNKAPLKIKRKFEDRLGLFFEDPYHPQLHNHLLVGKFAQFRSISISGDWRALYRVLEGDEEIYFFDYLGTHSQLYK